MKKKLNYKHSYLTYTTDITNKMIIEDNVEDWEAFNLIENITIDDRDPFRETLIKLICTAIKQIFDRGQIYIRLYLNELNDINKTDDALTVILGLGFEQVSHSREGRMFVLNNN